MTTAREAYKKFVAARVAVAVAEAKKDRRKLPAARVALRRAVVDLLSAYVPTDDGVVPEPFPPEVALYLRDEQAILAEGLLPDAYRMLARPGRRDLPSQREDKRDALDYIAAVDLGLIADADPVGTVAQMFSLPKDRATLRRTI